MNMPYQVYCDYLEDKGIDCRLLRTEEPDGLTLNSFGTFLGDSLNGQYDYNNGDGYSTYENNSLYSDGHGDGMCIMSYKIFYMYSYKTKYLGSNGHGA